MIRTCGGERHDQTTSALGAAVAAGFVAIALAFGASSSRTSAASPVITTNLSGPQRFQAGCASCHGMAAYGRVLTMDGQTIRTPTIRDTALAKIDTKHFDAQARRTIVEGIDEQG